MKTLSTRTFAALTTALMMAVIGLTLALLTVGTPDCRTGPTGGFCALRISDGSGASVQYVNNLTVWSWGPDGCCNRRLWPKAQGVIDSR